MYIYTGKIKISKAFFPLQVFFLILRVKQSWASATAVFFPNKISSTVLYFQFLKSFSTRTTPSHHMGDGAGLGFYTGYYQVKSGVVIGEKKGSAKKRKKPARHVFPAAAVTRTFPTSFVSALLEVLASLRHTSPSRNSSAQAWKPAPEARAANLSRRASGD